MRKILLLFLFIAPLFIKAQELNKTSLDKKGKLILLGKTNVKAFDAKPFEWYQKNYDTYITNDNVIEKFKDSLQNYTIKAFYGSWCGDSKRELPRFYKVLEKANFNMNNLEAVAVDRKPEAYKASPNGEEKGLNIHRVPTFIFYKNGEEVNRIVEFPKQDFERDIYAILSGKRYVSNYQVVNYLNNLIQKKGIDSLQLQEKELIPIIAEYTKGSRELNTYGYKLLLSNQPKKALYIFDLNTKMYPYKYNVFDSLGEAFYEDKNYEEALKNYAKVLTLNPKNKNAIEMIEKINTKIK
jgi:thiol-disulfide isomerase/thioredoxin